MNGRTSLVLLVGICCLAVAFAASTSNSKRLVRTRIVGSDKIEKRALDAPKTDSTKAIIQVAKALARSHSTSEVLTLNLTNLLILIVLKAIIFGIGLFYFGGVSFKGGHGDSHGGGYGRSLGGKPLMTEGEVMLMLTYLLGAANDKYDCMYRVACEDPSKAKSYLNASKMLLKGAKFAKKYVTYNPKYENVVYGLQDAVDFKAKGGECSSKYICSDVPQL